MVGRVIDDYFNVDHTWDYTYQSVGTFGMPNLLREMEVYAPTDDSDYIRLAGMICSFACFALEFNMPLGALKVRGKRPPS